MDAPDDVKIRPERPADGAAIRAVHERAFGQPAEAALVDALRAAGALTLSLVAEADRAVVGHVAFSPVTIVAAGETREAVGLAPMAVIPDRQHQGVGSRLVREGLAELARAGHGAVVVLGHADYYPRFGFVPAHHFDVRWEHDCPPEAFMALELRSGALAGLDEGVVRYHPAFDAV